MASEVECVSAYTDTIHRERQKELTGGVQQEGFALSCAREVSNAKG